MVDSLCCAPKAQQLFNNAINLHEIVCEENSAICNEVYPF